MKGKLLKAMVAITLATSCAPDEVAIKGDYSWQLIQQTAERNRTFQEDLENGIREWIDNNLQDNMYKQKVFFCDITSLAVVQELKYNIPIEVTLAQAALESSWGKSKLAVESNNYFGIKDYRKSSHSAKSYPTLEYKDNQWRLEYDNFKVYSDKSDCFESRSLWFVHHDKYHYLFETRETEPVDLWINALIENGYATDPNYANIMYSIIDKYKLRALAGWVRDKII